MKPTQRAFTAGELDPALHERADLQRYYAGLARCENFIVVAQGGVVSRPGLRFIGPLDDHTKRGRLIPFEFNTEQAYILVFEHLLMRVVKDGGFVVDSGSPPNLFELVTPYTEADLPFLIFVQDADVMTITCRGYDPRTLSRTDHDAWSLDVISYTASTAAPGTITPTAVGTASGSANKTYRYVVTTVDDNGVESVPSPECNITQNALSVTYGVKLDWTAVTGASYYRIYKDPSNGSGVYGWIGDSVNNTYEDYNIEPVTSDAPPSDYLPFAAADRKPATVGYYQQRQVYANVDFEVQTVFTTQTGIYNSFRSSQPPRDDDALEFTIKSRTVNEVRHILDLDALVLLTSGAEWRITEGQDMVLTPGTLGARAFSYFGSSWCRPALVGDSAVYVQEKGNRVRDLFSVNAQGVTGTDLTLLARHLFENAEVEEMSYSAEPYGVVWAVRNDGVLLGLTYQRESEIWAWHQHTTDGEFESVATIPEDGRDATYVIVKRVINGNTVRYVERLEARDVSSAENCFFVDSGLTYDGVPADVISGLDHLEGEEVAVLADGNEVPGLTVVIGQIALPQEASIVHVGLPYTPALETLPLAMPSGEDIRTSQKSIHRLEIKVKSSRGGFVAPIKDDGTADTDKFVEFPPRFESDGYGTIALKTQLQSVVMYDGWTTSGAVRIEQRSPLPLEILSIFPETDVD